MFENFKKIGALLLLLTIAAGVIFATSKSLEKKSVEGVRVENTEYEADVDGDGTQEKVILEKSEERVNAIYIEDNGNESAATPEGFTTPIPIESSFRVYNLETASPADNFSFDFIAGPHQIERMFFGVFDDIVSPLCLKEEVESPYDCLFYTTIADGIIVRDLDSDGFSEVIELTNEYPSEGELTDEEIAAISAAGESLPEFAVGAERIAKRERGGEGRTVVWSIYVFNGVYFEKQEGEKYIQYFNLLKEDFPEVVAKEEISQDSINYTDFVRKFWAEGITE